MFGFIKKMLGSTPNTTMEAYLVEGAILIDVRSASEYASGTAP